MLSPLPTSLASDDHLCPDTHQPLTIPCSTAGGTPPLRTYAQSVSLKPPSPHPQAGRAPSSPEAAVSCPLTPAERGRPAGQLVIGEDGPCSHNLFSGNCQGRVESRKKNLGGLRGLGPPPTAGSVTQWAQPPPLVTLSHPNLRPWELKKKIKTKQKNSCGPSLRPQEARAAGPRH